MADHFEEYFDASHGCAMGCHVAAEASFHDAIYCLDERAASVDALAEAARVFHAPEPSPCSRAGRDVCLHACCCEQLVELLAIVRFVRHKVACVHVPRERVCVTQFVTR